MMTTDIRTGIRLGSALVGAVLLLACGACGGKVVLEGEIAGEGGGGASASSNVSASSAESSSSTGGGVLCAGGENETCTGLGTNVCKCIRSCGDTQLKANCAPDDKGVIVCICSYDDVFSGTCFEKTDAVCNISKGCCAKYFQGI
jgi:hypothetical protein